MDVDETTDDDLLYADLFSGCGGMSLGFKWAGFECVGALDINENACKTYAANIGTEPLNKDITKYSERTPEEETPEDLMDEFGVEPGELDVLISCAPCQGFSQHRNKDDGNKHEDRNTLVSLSAELAVAIDPEFFVMENVPELIRRPSYKEEYWEPTYQILKKAGYVVKPGTGIINAADYGVPQRRNRAIIIARKDGRKTELPSSTVRKHATVEDAIRSLPDIEAGETYPKDDMHRAPDHTERIVNMLHLIPDDGGSWMDIEGEENQEKYWLDSMKKRWKNGDIGSYCDTYGRLHWDRIAPTITRKSSTPSCGRFVHPEQNRNISVREAALLQSFPVDKEEWSYDDLPIEEWEFKGPFISWYEQNGNAVPPLLGNAIAEKVRELNETDEKIERQATFDEIQN
jgi:DNA (cytosine-5)-methyltransferase 1